jgi:hypothetical protein
MRCANMRKPRMSLIITPQQLGSAQQTFVAHLVAGVPLLKVGVGPSNGAELNAVPPYCGTSVLTASLLPGRKSITYHIISISIQSLWPALNLAVSQSVHSPLLILLEATPICPRLTLLLSLHIPLDLDSLQSIVTYQSIPTRLLPVKLSLDRTLGGLARLTRPTHTLASRRLTWTATLNPALSYSHSASAANSGPP